MKLYVGIDPSYSGTGVVVLDKEGQILACTSIKAPSEGSNLHRAVALRNDVLELILSHGLERDAPFVAIENYSLNSKFGLAMLVTMGTVLRMALLDRGWPYVEPAPQAVKAFALMPGKKTTKKQKPVAEAEKLWGFKHKSKDVVDAYVLAQIARAAGGAQALGHLDVKQIDVVAKLRAC